MCTNSTEPIEPSTIKVNHNAIRDNGSPTDGFEETPKDTDNANANNTGATTTTVA